jgi:hypothetical protein
MKLVIWLRKVADLLKKRSRYKTCNGLISILFDYDTVMIPIKHDIYACSNQHPNSSHTTKRQTTL